MLRNMSLHHTAKRRERARAEEIVKVSVSFSLTCFAHFSFCFSRWIFGFRLTIVNSLSPFRNDLSRKFQRIYFFLNKYSLFHEESFFF